MKITIHKLKNISLSSILQPCERSALDKNFKARASSRKPKVTFTAFSHPPAFPKTFNFPGKKAKKAKGNASANEKPNMPISGP